MSDIIETECCYCFKQFKIFKDEYDYEFRTISHNGHLFIFCFQCLMKSTINDDETIKRKLKIARRRYPKVEELITDYFL